MSQLKMYLRLKVQASGTQCPCSQRSSWTLSGAKTFPKRFHRRLGGPRCSSSLGWDVVESGNTAPHVTRNSRFIGHPGPGFQSRPLHQRPRPLGGFPPLSPSPSNTWICLPVFLPPMSTGCQGRLRPWEHSNEQEGHGPCFHELTLLWLTIGRSDLRKSQRQKKTREDGGAVDPWGWATSETASGEDSEGRCWAEA